MIDISKNTRKNIPITKNNLIILAHYINIGGLSKARAEEEIKQYVDRIESTNVENESVFIKNYYIFSETENKVECLYPTNMEKVVELLKENREILL